MHFPSMRASQVSLIFSKCHGGTSTKLIILAPRYVVKTGAVTYQWWSLNSRRKGNWRARSTCTHTPAHRRQSRAASAPRERAEDSDARGRRRQGVYIARTCASRPPAPRRPPKLPRRARARCPRAPRPRAPRPRAPRPCARHIREPSKHPRNASSRAAVEIQSHAAKLCASADSNQAPFFSL